MNPSHRKPVRPYRLIRNARSGYIMVVRVDWHRIGEVLHTPSPAIVAQWTGWLDDPPGARIVGRYRTRTKAAEAVYQEWTKPRDQDVAAERSMS